MLWGAWFFVVDRLFVAHGRADLTEGRKSPAGLVASVFYWPLAWLCWKAAYPSGGWVLPWHQKGDDVDPDVPSPEELRASARVLAASVGDRLAAPDRSVVELHLASGKTKAAIEHLVIRMVEDDQRLTADEGERLLSLAIPLQIRDRAGRDLYFLAKRM